MVVADALPWALTSANEAEATLAAFSTTSDPRHRWLRTTTMVRRGMPWPLLAFQGKKTDSGLTYARNLTLTSPVLSGDALGVGIAKVMSAKIPLRDFPHVALTGHPR